MILNYDSDNGLTFFFDKIKWKTIEVSEEANKFFNTLSKTDNIATFAASFETSDSALQNFIKDVDSSQWSLSNYQSYLQSTAKQTTSFASITQKAGSALKTIGGIAISTLGNIAVSYAVAKGIELIGTGIYNVIHATEIAIEKGKEARDTIASINEEYQNKSNVVNNSGQRFDELRGGVNQATNENISLTNDQYSEYLSLCNEIAGIYPELVTSYDAQGNAILNLGSNAQSATDQLQSMLEVDQQIANLKIADNLQTAFEGSKAEYQQLQNQIDGLEQSSKNYKNITESLDSTSKFTSNLYKQLDELANGKRSSLILDTINPDITQKLKDSFKDNGLLIDMFSSSIYDSNGDGVDDSQIINFLGLPDKSAIESAVEKVKDDFKVSAYEFSNTASEIRDENLLEISSLKEEQENVWNELLPSLEATLRTNPNYSQMTEDVQNGIMDALSNVDITSLPDDIKVEDYIKKTFLYPLSGIFNDEAATEVQNSINKLFSLDKSKLNVSDYEDNVNSLLSTMKDYYIDTLGESVGEESFNDFVIKFGFKIVDEDGRLINSKRALQSEIEDLAALKGEDAVSLGLDKLTVDQLIELDTKVSNSSYGGTVEDAINEIIKQAKLTINSTEPITFSSLFKDSEGKATDFSKQMDTFKSNVSSLNEARNTLLSGETVDMTELFSNFPALAQQSENLIDSLNKLKNQNIADSLSSAYKEMSTSKNSQDVASMKNYLVGLIADSASELSENDMQQVQSMLVNSIAPVSSGRLEREEASQWVKSLFDGVTDNINPMKKLSNQMDRLKSSVQEIQNRVSLNDSLGIKNTKNDYRSLLDNSKQQVRNLQQQNEELQKSLVGLNENSDAYKSISSQIQDNVSSINEARQAQQEWNDTVSQLDYQPQEGLTAYNKAKQTRNAGDNYLDMLSAAKEAQEARDKGLIGTDDFKTVAKMFSPNDMDDYQNWDENYGKIKRYFTEGDTGAKNFLNDLSQITRETDNGTIALAEFDDSTKTWSYNIDDVQASADALGISFEAFLAVMGRLQDYGFSNDFFSSVEDGQDHIADLYVALSDAESKLKELEDAQSNGDETVTDTVLSAQENRVNQIKQSILESQDLLNQLVNKSASDYEEEYAGKVSSLTQRLSEAGNIEDEGARKSYISKIKDWAESEAININDLFTADGGVNQEVLSKLQDEYQIDLTPSTEHLDKATQEISDKLKSAYENSDSGMKEWVDSLKGYTQEQLSSITFGDGKYDELADAESAIDNIILSLGLSQNEASALIQTLAQMGLIDTTVDYNADTSKIDEATSKIESSNPTVNVETEADTKNLEAEIKSGDYTVEAMVTAKVDDAVAGTENREATVDYKKGDQDKPEDQMSLVNYKIGVQELPETKTAKVNYTLGTQALPQEKTVKVHYDTSGAPKASGTLLTAHTDGTAYNVLNLRAHASGTDVSIKKDEVALINELGTEAIIRDGKLYEVPGGTHMQSLKRGDVVINAAQWAEIKKYGSTNTFAGNAYASGTFNRIPLAHAYANNVGGGFVGSSSSPLSSVKAETNTSKSVEKTSSKVKKSLDKILESLEKLYDWIEVRLQRLQQDIDLSEAKSENAVGYQNKNKYLASAQSTTAALIKANKEGAARYKKQADTVAKKVGLSSSLKKKVDNGTIDIQSLSEDNKKRVEAYKQWYDKMKDCQQAVEDLKASQRDLAQQKLDNIIDQYDSMISHIEHQASLIDGFIDQAELKGYIQSTKYYDALIKNAVSQKTEMEKERTALINTFQESVNSGIITVGSVEWANMQSQINEVTKAIQKADTSILEFKNNIREINWDIFDKGREMVEHLTHEADFLIDLMSNGDLFDDKGRATDQGMATAGLHGVNYNTYMEQANEYGTEMKRISKELASDPYNQDLIDRRNELLNLQQESIQAAEDEKQAIKNLVKDGIEKELDALQDLIDKYTDALDSQKDLFTYQKDISDQTKELSSLYKQYSVYSNDDSEQGRLKAQETKNAIEEAKAKLQETEYDKYFSDQKDLLDTLYKEYEDVLNSRLDNVDQLVSDMIQTINDNAASISDILHQECEAVGYTMTNQMETIWGQSGSITNVLSTYSSNFSSTMTTLQVSIDSILEAIRAATGQSDKQAKSDVSTATTNNNNNPTVTGTTNPTTTPAKTGTTTPTKTNTTSAKSTSTQGDGKIQVGDKVKYISGKYYAASNGSGNSGSQGRGGYMYVTKINSKGKYPYHLSKGKKLGSSDRGWVKKSQISGYASGTMGTKQNELARLNEDGEEIITLPDGSLLMPLKKGTGVVNNPNTEKLIDLANDYDKIQKIIGSIGVMANAEQMKTVKEFVKTIAANSVENNNTGNSFNGDVRITFELPNVNSYEDFANKLVRDDKMIRAIQDSTIGAINGKSKLNKYKHKW